MREYSVIYLNGIRKEVRGRDALLMLADWLRKEMGLIGTKIVCAEGDCGACTVLRAFSPTQAGSLQFEAMNSCIATVAQMDGSHLVTVEGIQNGSELSSVQKAMRECHGSQCGYCTPGFVMALTGALEVHPALDAKTACNYLTGNLCRCTGYQPIIDAAVLAKRESSHSLSQRYLKKEAVSDLIETRKEALQIKNGGKVFFAPVSLKDAARFAAENPGFRVVGAGTDLGVQTNKGRPLPEAMLSLHLIPELYEIQKEKQRLIFGARVTLSQIRQEVESSNPEFARFLNLFASPQIKNVATLVGNIANASPIGDTLPFLLVSNGKIHVASWDPQKKSTGKREIPLTGFFKGYKKTALDPSEIITHISFEKNQKSDALRLYKVSQRKDLDISTVSSAYFIRTSSSGKKRKIEEARIAYGGVAAMPIRIVEVEQWMQGKELNSELLKQASERILKAISPQTDLRGTKAYRKVLAVNLFKKFGLELLHGE